MAATNSRALGAPPRATEQANVFAALYADSRANEVGLTLEEFAGVLGEVCSRYLPQHATEEERMRFCKSLQLEELALARACAKGSEAAWDRFVDRYRPKLRNAARSIANDEARACELADSLYAELFGTRQTAEGGRNSKLASYMGRGSLEGWLKTVLAQEYVNQIRRERRLVSFDESIGEPISGGEASLPADPHVKQALDIAISELSAEDRVLLASYYLDGRRLADIGRMLGMHESTVSRRLDKITSALRKRTLRSLRERGMSARQAEEAIAADLQELSIESVLLKELRPRV